MKSALLIGHPANIKITSLTAVFVVFVFYGQLSDVGLIESYVHSNQLESFCLIRDNL